MRNQSVDLGCYKLTNEAYLALRNILIGNISSCLSLEWMANDPDGAEKLATAAQIKMGYKFFPDKSGVTSLGENLQEWIAAEHKRQFQTLRKSALVSACAALENTAQSFYVEWALHDISKVKSAPSKTSKLIRHDLLLDKTERLFHLADCFYKETQGKPFSDRIKDFVSRTVPHCSARFETDLAQIPLADLNEAFLTRNCIVHRAARVGQRLSSITKEEIGTEISLDQDRMARMFRVLLMTGEALLKCSALGETLSI